MQTRKVPVSNRPDMRETDAGISRLQSSSAQLADIDLDVVVIDTMVPLAQVWRDLESDDLNSLHQGYDWCRSWAQAYQNPLAILWGKLAGATAFILPVEITGSHGVRVARFIGADHSNINTGLFSARFLDVAGDLNAHRFADLFRQALAGRADLLLLQNIPLEWRGRKNPLAILPMVQNQNHAYRLPFLGSFEATLTQLNAKGRRKKFRLQSKRLEAIGGFEYVAGGPTGDQHRLLDRFFQQKSGRFEALGLPDVFAAPETRAFFHGAVDIRDQDRRILGLEMHAIRLTGEHDGHIAAISGISRKGDHVICQFSSIDESVAADASPGEFLFWKMIEGHHDKGVSMFDFGLGDQGYKRSWAPVETAHYDVVLPLTTRGSFAGLAHRAITRSKAFIKSHARLYRIAQRMRRMIGV